MINISLLGNWTGNRAYGYSKLDHGILTSEKGVAKIKRLFKAPHNLNLSFIRSSGAKKLVEEGERTAEWIKEKTGGDVHIEEDSFNVAFCQNIGTEKIPMTAWCIAHRIGHSVWRNWAFRDFFLYFHRFMVNVGSFYSLRDITTGNWWDMRMNKQYLHLCYNIGTMRSCREHNLVHAIEFAHELIAQYLICGAIKFKELGSHIFVSRRFNWGREQKTYRGLFNATVEQVNDELISAANIMNDMLYYAFDNMIGGLVVM